MDNKYCVKITSVDYKSGAVSVKGTAKNLGQLKVEVMLNGDFKKAMVDEGILDFSGQGRNKYGK